MKTFADKNKIVTPNTARQLAAAGFPQEDTKAYWVFPGDFSTPFIWDASVFGPVAEFDDAGIISELGPSFQDGDTVFAAPDALDILQQMGNLIHIYYHINMFFCSHQYSPIEHYSENPAEACAKMYLNYFAPKK
jgi:hypothetical protein